MMAEADGSAKIIAGGQSLGPMLNLRLVAPDLLIDITGLSELKQAERDGDDLVIGACITHGDIEDGRIPDVTRGAMQRVACAIAYRAVRNRGTIGGSLSHADPAADWVSALRRAGRQRHAAEPCKGRAISRSRASSPARWKPRCGPARSSTSVRVPAMPRIGTLGLRQGLPQARRIRPRHGRGADRSGGRVVARRSSAPSTKRRS